MYDLGAGIENTFEVDYEELVMTNVHVRGTVAGEYEDFGIQIYCECE